MSRLHDYVRFMAECCVACIHYAGKDHPQDPDYSCCLMHQAPVHTWDEQCPSFVRWARPDKPGTGTKFCHGCRYFTFIKYDRDWLVYAGQCKCLHSTRWASWVEEFGAACEWRTSR